MVLYAWPCGARGGAGPKARSRVSVLRADRTDQRAFRRRVGATSQNDIEQGAFAALYRRYLTPVYRYLYARTGDMGLAEDLTLQTFVVVLEGLLCCRVELDGVLFAVEGP